MNRFTPFSLAAGCAGLALLGLSLLPLSGLSQGGTSAQIVLFLSLLALALAALGLLRRAGYAPERLWTALLPIGLALFFRAAMLDYASEDYKIFLAQWAATFRDNGGFAAIRMPIGNYNVPYLYFLAAISYLPLPDLYLIKLFSICFDVVLAWGGLRLVRRFTGRDSLAPLACFCALLLLPTVMLNGAYWGQCDSLYGALTLHALASALEGRPKTSAALVGVAFSFKLQTVFLLPLWAILWMAKRVRFQDLLLAPAAYAATCVPALLLGKPLGDILGVYLGQTKEGAGALNYNCASIYSFLPYGVQPDEATGALLGILAAFLLVAALLAAAFRFRARLDNRALLLCGVVLAAGVPFLLPYMHDRYFFLADVLTLVWACLSLRGLPAAVLVELASLSAYLTYFRMKYTLLLYWGDQVFTMLGESLLVLGALVWSCILLAKRLTGTPPAPDGIGKNTTNL